MAHKLKIRLLIDMDNTIVDYSSEMARQLRIVYRDESITAENWDTVDYPDLHMTRREIQSGDHFFLRLDPVPHAVEALKQISEDERFEIFIVSSPSIHSETCHSDKCTWLRKHLGDAFARNLILTKDKTLISGDVLIDDKPFITGVVPPEQVQWKLVTFLQPYNEGIEDRVYLRDWREWKQTIESVL